MSLSPQDEATASCEIEEPSLYRQLARAALHAGSDHIAIINGRRRLSYSALLAASDRLSDLLIDADVQAGEPVAVLMDNVPEYLVAAFGIWRRGAILLPLSSQLREQEIKQSLSNSGARAVLTGINKRMMMESLRHSGVPINHMWLFDETNDHWMYDRVCEVALSARAANRSNSFIEPSPPAVTQFSTGSTGIPKRVTRSHSQLVGEAMAVAQLLSIQPEDRILGVAPLFHSYGLVVSALVTLLSGATLYLFETFLPSRVAYAIERERITGLPGVPFMFALLCDLDASHDFSSLRFALSAGAPLPRATAARIWALYGVAVQPLYGSTETGVISLSAARLEDEGTSVGLPIPGVSVSIVDDTGHELPTGEVGQVRVRSSFAPMTYDTEYSHSESHFLQEYFFPGDQGKLLPDGQLTLCGRQRRFINVRGLKVDPVEVEVILLQLPNIVEAVVFGVRDVCSGEKVKAVLVTPHSLSHEAVRQHCARHLAPFKCPSIIEIRDGLPRNSLGKVLLKNLMEEQESLPIGPRSADGST